MKRSDENSSVALEVLDVSRRLGPYLDLERTRRTVRVRGSMQTHPDGPYPEREGAHPARTRDCGKDGRSHRDLRRDLRRVESPLGLALGLALACPCIACLGSSTSFVELPGEAEAQSAILLVVPANEDLPLSIYPVVLQSPDSGSPPSASGASTGAVLSLAEGDTVHVLYYRCPVQQLRLEGATRLVPTRNGRPLPRTSRVETAMVGQGGRMSFARGEWPQELLENYSLEPALDPCEGLEPGPEVSVGTSEPLITSYGDEGVVTATIDGRMLKLIGSESNGTSTALTTKTTTIALGGVVAADFHAPTKTLYVLDWKGIVHALHARDAGVWEKGFETTRSSTQAISSSDPQAFQLDRTQMVACDTDRGVELWVAGSNTFPTSPTALRVAAYEDTGRVLRLKAEGEILKTPGQSEDTRTNDPDLAWTCADGESPIALVPDEPRRFLAALRPSTSSASSTPGVSYSTLSVLEGQEAPFAILAHSELGLVVGTYHTLTSRILALRADLSTPVILDQSQGSNLPSPPVLVEAPPVRDERSGSEHRGLLWYGGPSTLRYVAAPHVEACTIRTGRKVDQAVASGHRVYLRVRRITEASIRALDFEAPNCALHE